MIPTYRYLVLSQRFLRFTGMGPLTLFLQLTFWVQLERQRDNNFTALCWACVGAFGGENRLIIHTLQQVFLVSF